MSFQMHLKKTGSGMASMTACGRNILRTHMSMDWAGFKKESDQWQCQKCVDSKLFSFLTRKDADAWQPVEDPDAWKKADDALIAKRK